MKISMTSMTGPGRWIGSPRVYVPILFLSGLFLMPLLISSPFYQNILILILLNATLAAAWNIPGGFAGQLSLGHAAFFGIGAYTSSLLFVKASIPPMAGLFGSIVAAGVLAFLIGYTCFKLKGPFFVLATIAIGEVFLVVATVWRSMTRGTFGLFLPAQYGWSNLIFKNRMIYVYLILALTVCVVGGTVWLLKSRLGIRLRCIREDEDAAEAVGIPTTRMKIVALMSSAAITAACGTFFAQYFLFIDPGFVFSIDVSIQIALAAIIGGMGSPLGPALGAVILTPIQEFLRGLLGGAYQGLYGIVYGGALIVIVMLLPQGVIGWAEKAYERFLSFWPDFLGDRQGVTEAAALPAIPSLGVVHGTNPGEPKESILRIRNAWKHFGGITAIKDVSMEIRRGEIVGLIGPNGSGKTTLFNLIAGFHTASSGDFFFSGKGMPRHRRPHLAAQLGISRTFQLIKPFERLTVLENALAAALLRTTTRREAEDVAREVLKSVGLERHEHRLARELTLGERKRLEIARGLATRPRLLLLDEVMSGLNPSEMEEVLRLVRNIRERGITVLMVEHKVDAIMKVSDRIIVLHHGEKIAEGLPSEIATNRKVIEVYLGKRYGAHGIRKA